MYDNRTPHLNLPLPSSANQLEEDVPRLIEALNSLDTKLAALDTLLGSDDTTLDTLQEMVTAIKSEKTTIDSILLNKADKSVVDGLSASKADQTTVSAIDVRVTDLENATHLPQEEDQLLSDTQTQVDLAELTTLVGAKLYVGGIRLRKTEWSVDGTVPTRLHLAKAYPGGFYITIEI